MLRKTRIEDINLFNLLPADLREDKAIQGLLNDVDKVNKALDPIISEIPYREDSTLNKEVVQEIEGMEWMKEVEFHLAYAQLTSEEQSIQIENKYLDNLIDKLKKSAMVVPEYISECGQMMVALDTETTSLVVDFKIYGGTLNRELSLVGIPLAVSSSEGYYLPVNHNETDGIRNFSERAIIRFLQRLVNEFFVIYFNFEYDASVLQLHGIRLDSERYADVYHIANAIGVDTLPDIGFSKGLKALSKYFLDRKMLEVNEVVGSKSHIIFSRISAKDAITYAIADAVNTFGLFEELVLNEDSEDYNPYLYNGTILTLDHKTLFHSISMFRHNLPLNDLEGLAENLKTILNRVLILNETYMKIDGAKDYSIGSSDAVNYFLGSKILNELLVDTVGKTLNINMLRPENLEKRVKVFIDAISEDFALECKIEVNKSRGEFIKFATRKTGWGKSAKGLPVLEYIKKNIHNEYWAKMLSEEFRDEIYFIADLTDNYRGMILETQRLGKMYRYAEADDRGYATANINLRFSSADTRRFKNSSGNGGSRLIFSGKDLHLISYYGGNGLCGINAQGLPSTPYNIVRGKSSEKGQVKRILKIGSPKLSKWFRRKVKMLNNELLYQLKTKFNQKK